MAAKVESAGGEYAYIDDAGKYKLKMPFDESSRTDGTASLPVPMAQFNSGPDYGAHFPVHEKNDMLLAFVDGDVDRPYAIGTLPNPNNSSPVKAANKAQNIIRTKAGNQLIMDDTTGETQIQLNTPDQHTMLFDDKEDRIMLTSTSMHNMVLDDKNKKVEIKTKDGHFALMDDQNRKVTFQSKDGHSITVSDQDELITIIDQSGQNLFQIDIGSNKLTLSTAQGDIEVLAPAGTIDLKATTINLESTAETTIKAGTDLKSEAGVNVEAKAGVNMTHEAGVNYSQKGTNVASEATAAHDVKGAKVVSEGQASNDVKGSLVNVQATGINTITGSIVKIN